jgi:hypothetical protein
MEAPVIDSRYVLCALALALPMCGGMQAEPAAAPSPAPATGAAPALAAPSGSTAVPAATPAGYPGAAPPALAPPPAEPSPVSEEAPPRSATVDTTKAPSREAQRSAARSELERWEASLKASVSDCAAACRALASMSRAAEHLCALVDSSDDQRRCDDAKRRVAGARDRVRQTCGVCSP